MDIILEISPLDNRLQGMLSQTFKNPRRLIFIHKDAIISTQELTVQSALKKI